MAVVLEQNQQTSERAQLFEKLADLSAAVTAQVKALRERLNGPRQKQQAAERTLAKAQAVAAEIRAEVAALERQEQHTIFSGESRARKLRHQILRATPVIREYITRFRNEVEELEAIAPTRYRLPTGRKNANGVAEILLATNAASIGARRTALVNACRQAEELAVTVPDEDKLCRRLEELYDAIPPIEAPSLKDSL